MISYSAKFYLRDSQKVGSKLKLYLRIICDRKKTEASYPYFIDPNNWDDKAQQCKGNDREDHIINEVISEAKYKISKIHRELSSSDELITAPILKDILLNGKGRKRNMLFELYDEYLDKNKSSGRIKSKTYDKYLETRRLVHQFVKRKFDVNDIAIKRVDYNFYQDFDHYMITKKKKHSSETMSQGTVSKHHSRFRTFLHDVVKRGLIVTHPYFQVRLPNPKVEHVFLVKEELKSLALHALNDNKSLCKVRDMFVFACYTGLRFSDVQELTMKSIQSFKGRNYVFLDQKKTEIPVKIPIRKPAQTILDRYEDIDERKLSNKAFPKISNQKINYFLKIIADIVGIEKKLTFHVARHTCATRMLSTGKSLEDVQVILGHKSKRSTEIYAQYSMNAIERLAKRMDQEDEEEW